MNDDLKNQQKRRVALQYHPVSPLGFSIIMGVSKSAIAHLPTRNVRMSANLNKGHNDILEQMAAYRLLKKTEVVKSFA